MSRSSAPLWFSLCLCAAVLSSLAALGIVGYVAYHFLMKVW